MKFRATSLLLAVGLFALASVCAHPRHHEDDHAAATDALQQSPLSAASPKSFSMTDLSKMLRANVAIEPMDRRGDRIAMDEPNKGHDGTNDHGPAQAQAVDEAFAGEKANEPTISLDDTPRQRVPASLPHVQDQQAMAVGPVANNPSAHAMPATMATEIPTWSDDTPPQRVSVLQHRIPAQRDQQAMAVGIVPKNQGTHVTPVAMMAEIPTSATYDQVQQRPYPMQPVYVDGRPCGASQPTGISSTYGPTVPPPSPRLRPAYRMHFRANGQGLEPFLHSLVKAIAGFQADQGLTSVPGADHMTALNEVDEAVPDQMTPYNEVDEPVPSKEVTGSETSKERANSDSTDVATALTRGGTSGFRYHGQDALALSLAPTTIAPVPAQSKLVDVIENRMGEE